MPDKVEFEKGEGGTIRFQEKHIRTIETTTAISNLLAEESSGMVSRNWGKAKEDRAAKNTLLCMTIGHQQALFSNLLKYKASELSKIKRNADTYTNVSGIQLGGCAIVDGEAWYGGTWTLGIVRATGTVLRIVHLGYWDWTGRGKIAPTATFTVT